MNTPKPTADEVAEQVLKELNLWDLTVDSTRDKQIIKKYLLSFSHQQAAPLVEALMSAQYHYTCLEAAYRLSGDEVGLLAMRPSKEKVNDALASLPKYNGEANKERSGG